MRILHLEENAADAQIVGDVIRGNWPECEIRCVATRFAFVGELSRAPWDLILSDFALEAMNGLETLQLARERAPETPFIFLSGTIGEDRAIEAVRAGAADYVLKDRMKRLVTAITRALRDSHERGRRREAESRSRELTAVLDQAREAVIVTDLEGRVTFWNQGAAHLTGVAAGEALGRTCVTLFGPAATGLLSDACHAVLAHGEWVGELSFTDRGGARREMELRLSLVRDEDGRPGGRLALGTDITARRQAERRVREQAEMLNQAREAIFISDAEDRVIYWNAGAERLLGWRAEEVLGQLAEGLFDPSNAAELDAAREATLTQGRWNGELRLHSRKRDPITVESRQTLIRDETGTLKARLWINSDITDRRRLEDQFLRAQRMENIGLLAAGIAHDLNNMLAPILLAAPMLRDYVRDPAALGLLSTLERSAERGGNLVRQILAFAQGNPGERRLLEPRHLLRDIAAVVAGTFPKSIRLEFKIPSDLRTVHANATQIHQVVLNLCVNARDAMPHGGTLTLTAENCVLDAAGAAAIEGARAGPFVAVQVSDDGAGIAPAVLARMWEPFFTTKERGKGTGLGLSTVRGIVENHAGFVRVASEVGRGSVFRVYLPAAEAPAPVATPVPAHRLPPGRGELILVVDDERHIRDMTLALLTRAGYRVILAADGVEAAAVFARRAAEIRLVITDLHMPHLDGATFARALRLGHPDVRVLVFSGLTSALGDRPDYKPEEFADGVLHKPFKPDRLLAKVHEVLHGPRSVARRPVVSPEAAAPVA